MYFFIHFNSYSLNNKHPYFIPSVIRKLFIKILNNSNEIKSQSKK